MNKPAVNKLTKGLLETINEMTEEEIERNTREWDKDCNNFIIESHSKQNGISTFVKLFIVEEKNGVNNENNY